LYRPIINVNDDTILLFVYFIFINLAEDNQLLYSYKLMLLHEYHLYFYILEETSNNIKLLFYTFLYYHKELQLNNMIFPNL
jgi:hypothetical protein